MRRAVRSINRFAKIHETRNSAVPLGEILDRGAFDLARILEVDPDFLEHGHDHEHHDHDGHDHHDHHHHHHDDDHIAHSGIDSVSLKADKPLDPGLFERWFGQILAEQGPDILRYKGILDIKGKDERFVVQGVHMIQDSDFQRAWKQGEPRWSRLVLIGRKLDKAKLEQAFAACVAR